MSQGRCVGYHPTFPLLSAHPRLSLPHCHLPCSSCLTPWSSGWASCSLGSQAVQLVLGLGRGRRTQPSLEEGNCLVPKADTAPLPPLQHCPHAGVSASIAALVAMHCVLGLGPPGPGQQEHAGHSFPGVAASGNMVGHGGAWGAQIQPILHLDSHQGAANDNCMPRLGRGRVQVGLCTLRTGCCASGCKRLPGRGLWVAAGRPQGSLHSELLGLKTWEVHVDREEACRKGAWPEAGGQGRGGMMSAGGWSDYGEV